MKIEERDKLFEEFFTELREILITKGHDYSIDTDCLDNFKKASEMLDLSPEAVWGVYFYKHVSAVMTWVREGKVESEGLKGRFLDIACYAFLGWLISLENSNKQPA